MDCLDKCSLNSNCITVDKIIKNKNVDTTIKTLNAKKNGIHYRLEYSPVGNNIENPNIIICGITPGHSTWEDFINSVRKNEPVEKAARESIYSNMRNNMFNLFDKIGLFDYLADTNDYWGEAVKFSDDKSAYWNKIFIDKESSNKCGIQLTQACNCAILRNNDSKQPSRAALNEIVRYEPRCLFNRFKITPSLKLIIFLGISLNMIKYWEESCYYDPSIKTVMIPHPSGSNIVFNNGDLYKQLSGNDSTQLKNAKRSIINAKSVIINLRSNC